MNNWKLLGSEQSGRFLTIYAGLDNNKCHQFFIFDSLRDEVPFFKSLKKDCWYDLDTFYNEVKKLKILFDKKLNMLRTK